MPTTLIAFSSTHGHTERIVGRLRDVLRTAGVDAEILHITATTAAGPGEVDGLIVAASVHGGHHQSQVVRWLQEHAEDTVVHPSVLVSVSLTAADPGAEGQTTARRYVDELLEETAWAPDEVACVAGALQYREYGPMMRLGMRLVAHQHHLPTDTAQDVDFTDWDAVDRVAHDFAAKLVAPAVPAP